MLRHPWRRISSTTAGGSAGTRGRAAMAIEAMPSLLSTCSAISLRAA
jgi:hypothetical protein